MLIYSGTENFVSALCASIPVIRPLWSQIVHGYTSSDGSYPSQSYQLSDMNSGNAERAIKGSSGAGPETRIYAREFRDASDNNSEDSILREAKNGHKEPGNEMFFQTEFSMNSNRDHGTPIGPIQLAGRR